jgi:cell division protein ZapA (FtsZ GTPase activity inhibitor)
MAEEPTQKQMITINEKEYVVDDLTDEQKGMLQQIANLDNKVGNLNMEMAQLQAARQFFVNSLSGSLEATDDNVAEELEEE